VEGFRLQSPSQRAARSRSSGTVYPWRPSCLGGSGVQCISRSGSAGPAGGAHQQKRTPALRLAFTPKRRGG
jgi:hypothetical protein